MSQPTDQRPRLVDAALLGLLHGPAELVPISSSGHVTLVPWLLGLPYSQIPAERRKAVEVALHAGTATALAAFPPSTPVTFPGAFRSLPMTALMTAPSAVVGLLARGRINSSLGTPSTIAAGLVAGSAALAAAERLKGSRPATELTPSDALRIGTAQVAALWPGVSRSAVTIAAARAVGFAPGDAARISRSGVVPTSAAAATLEGIGVHRSGRLGSDGPALAVAAATAFGSTLISRRLSGVLESGGSLLPWAGLRMLSATLALRRIRSLGDDGVR